jgi:hypothetical protein
VRVYLPATLRSAAALLAAGEVTPKPDKGYAVTPALREWYASGDTDELEYAAMAAAARASLALLATDTTAPSRRVVLAVDVDDRTVQLPHDLNAPAQVRLSAPVPVSRVAAVHVDEEVAATDVAAAVGALDQADAGDEDAAFVVDGAEGHELLWYATQELRDLVADITP